MLCVVLAGGLGTRMRSFTSDVPKALIPVGGVPFVDWQLAWLVQNGVDEVVMSIGYRGDMLRQHLGDGRRFGTNIRYVDEGENLRGTGGALRLALDEGVLSERFLVTYGDSFLRVDFRRVFASFVASGRPAAMTILQNEGHWDASNVVFEPDGAMLYDKRRRLRPHADYRFIDYGLLAFSRETIETRLRPGEVSDLAELLHDLSVEGGLAGIQVFERFYEIGSPEGLSDFAAWIESERARGSMTWAPQRD